MHRVSALIVALFVFLFRRAVYLRHHLTGWHPPMNERYDWFYEPVEPPVRRGWRGEPLSPYTGSGWDEHDLGFDEDDRQDEDDENLTEADIREVELLASEDAPDDRWRYDHMGNEPLG